MDYGKYRYEQAKKDRESRKGQKMSLLREVRLRPKIGIHDYDAKVRTAKKLLDGGDKVKISILFRGREITHPEIGWRLLQKMAEELKEIAAIDRQPAMDNRRMILMLSPLPQQKVKIKEELKKEVPNA
jgi:translation initiation factor IF-3